MLFHNLKIKKTILLVVIFISTITACTPSAKPRLILPTPEEPSEIDEVVNITPYPTRPSFEPGELVDYTAQAGDTIVALSARFNTTEAEIHNANPFIPENATTMPPGMPMQIPIYYRPLWGTPFQIIPDAAFVNGPDAIDFDTAEFVAQTDGWLKTYSNWAYNGQRSGAEMVDNIAMNYSVSPKLLLALLEFFAGALTQPELASGVERTLLGIDSNRYPGLYLQMLHASDLLNDGFYRWRNGELLEFELTDGSLVRPDPWQNAATVTLQHFFTMTLTLADYYQAIGPDGFIQIYIKYFGDPWLVDPHIPGSLVQPEMLLPFETDKVWAHTGGPHTGWGSLEPWAALDFAPPSVESGCVSSSVPTTAVADGLVVRDDTGVLILDLDGDGDERTGWVILYLHIAGEGRVPVGTYVKAGDPLGFPSCEGGRSTGTHIHIARKFNGEWVDADGVIPFVLSGWTPIKGDRPYQGWLVRDGIHVLASENPGSLSMIPAEED